VDKLDLTELDIVLMTANKARITKASITAYSTAVGPSSLRKNRSVLRPNFDI
jgi:hypothetical protein